MSIESSALRRGVWSRQALFAGPRPPLRLVAMIGLARNVLRLTYVPFDLATRRMKSLSSLVLGRR